MINDCDTNYSISFQNACTLTCITFLICTGYIYRDLHVPFETARDALIAQRVLQPDPILRPEDFQVEYEAKATVLDIHFKAIDDRVLRVGVSSVIDSIKSIVETIDELDPETM